MGSKSKSAPSKRTTASKQPSFGVEAAEAAVSADMDMDTRTNHSTEDVNDGDGEDDDIDMQGGNRESSDEESEIEDDVDQELRENAATVPKEAHTSDHIQRTLTDPEIESAFHDQYMTQITQAFGDELNTLRETDSLEGPHLELLIDSLNQTGHIYSAIEKALWVAEDSH
ncbi:hypothetical protein BGX34_008822 [Mortierella sp. NVP85]|nr:hypothetical protein BGX34_008822 [Mortierella sp. NVP85]